MTYTFGYLRNSLLGSINLKGGDGTSLNSTSYTYQDAIPDYNVVRQGDGTWDIPTVDVELYNSRYKGYTVTGDFSGDGRTDIATWKSGSLGNYLRVSLAKGDGTFYAAEDWPADRSGQFAADGSAHPRLWAADFDGDGKMDMASVDLSGKIWVHLSTGSDFRQAILWNSLCGQAGHGNQCAYTAGGMKHIRVGDFNGDGKADMLSWVSGSSGKKIRVFLSDGTGFSALDPDTHAVVNARDWDSDIYQDATHGMMVWMGDFNGDGRTDVLAWDNADAALRIHYSTGSNFFLRADGQVPVYGIYGGIRKDSTGAPLIWIGDFNGDGKVDVLSWDSSKTGTTNFSLFWMHYSRGGISGCSDLTTVHDTPLNIVCPMSNNPSKGPWLADFDGDGRTDIAIPCAGTDNVGIYRPVYSDGGDGMLIYTGTLAHLDYNATYGYTLWLGDFDGDGRTDIAGFKTGGNAVYMHSQTGLPARDLLSTVSNGLGGTTTLTYQPSSIYSNRSMPFVLQTVASKTVNDGNGVTSVITYDYADGYYDKMEREFYGFGFVQQYEPVSGVSLQTWYMQDQNEGIKTRFRGRVWGQDTWKAPTAGDPTGGLYKGLRNSYGYTTPYTNTAFACLKDQDTHICDGNCTEDSQSQLKILGGKKTTASFAYDPYGNLAQKCLNGDVIINGDERCENTVYSDDPNLTSKWILNRPATTWITDDITGTTKAGSSFTYYPNGNLHTKMDALNLVTGVGPIATYEYDSYGNRTTVTDPKGNQISTQYDTDTGTYPIKTIYPYPQTSPFFTEKTWDYRFGKPLTETDFNGRTTSYTYDVLGRISTIVKPPDTDVLPTTRYTYFDNLLGSVGDQKVRVETKDGDTTTTWKDTYFDGLGRTISVTRQGPGGTPDPGPITSDRTYNTRGLLSGQSLPHFGNETARTTTYEYDPLKRITMISRPDGTYETSSYDGWRTTLIDANGHKKVKETDGLGRLVKVGEYTGNEASNNFALYATTTYEYDPMGNLLHTRDISNHVSSMLYDPLSRKYSMTDHDMGTWAYRYDDNGNLTYQTDAMNRTVRFDYDSLNRVFQKTYISSTATPVVYTYDEATSENPKGRLTTVADASGSTRFSYDERGRTKSTTKIIDGTAYTVQSTYDSRDRVKSITYPGSSPETVSYVYNAAGNLTNVQSTVTNYAAYSNFNASGQPADLWYGNGVHTVYTYDITTTRLTDLLTLGGATLQDLHYDYDDVGNILTLTDIADSGKTQNFQYDELNRLRYATSTAYGTIEYRYDTIGNMIFNTRVGSYAYSNPLHVHAVTQAGTNSYTYDANGNMTGGEGRTFVWDYDNRPTSINGISMVYDYQGQRVKKGSTKYIGRLYECTGSTCTMYIFANRNRVAKKTGTTINYYHPDHLGSSSVVTGDGMTKVEEINYYPYGATRTDTGTVNVRHKYTGQEWDSETGLYYYGARYYHPAMGRFISADAIAQDGSNPQNLNPYSYVLNNPIKYVDPTGNLVCDEDGCYPDAEPIFDPTPIEYGPDYTPGLAPVSDVPYYYADLTSGMDDVWAGSPRTAGNENYGSDRQQAQYRNPSDIDPGKKYGNSSIDQEAKRLWLMGGYSADVVIGRGGGIGSSTYVTGDKPTLTTVDANSNFGLGAVKGVFGGWAFVSDPSKISGSGTGCLGACLTIYTQGVQPVGFSLGVGFLGGWVTSYRNIYAVSYGSGIMPRYDFNDWRVYGGW